MLHTRADIIQELSRLAEVLSGPLPIEAAADGWTPSTWTKWAGLFAQLQVQVGKRQDIVFASISRGLDMDGIHRGSFLERAAAVSLALRGLEES